MTTHQIKVDPRFFAKAKNEYSDWLWALIREFVQNCVDAPSCDKIDITIKPSGSTTVMTVANNGEPMTQDILTNKLLALGGTTKDNGNSIGGMGVAKNLLYLCHDSYTIHTGNLRVTGCGGEYNLDQVNYYNGTISTIAITETSESTILSYLKTFLLLTNWHGTATINGQTIQTKAKVTNLRKTLPWGKVYTGKLAETNRLIIRVNGVPMFKKWCDYKNTIVIELTGTSTQHLTANRDGLRLTAQAELDEFLAKLITNKKQALTQNYTTYVEYKGDKLNQENEARAIINILNQFIENKDLSTIDKIAAAKEQQNTRPAHTNNTNTAEIDSTNKNPLTYRFIIKNTTGMTIPQCYMPETFSDYAHKLAACWALALTKIAKLFGHKSSFSIGFVFDENAAAEYETTTKLGPVIYINPIQVVKQENSNSRSFKRARSFNATGKWAIIADAIHEFAHMIGYNEHNEDYANKLTDLFAIALQNRNLLTI